MSLEDGIVTLEMMDQLLALAPPEKAPERPARRQDLGPLWIDDVGWWLRQHGAPIVAEGPYGNGATKYILNPCPWNPAHTNRSAFVIQWPDGHISAGCHHNGCQGKNFADLRDVLEPGWRTRLERARAERREQVGERPREPTKFAGLSIRDVLDMPAPDWLIEGVAVRGSLSVLYSQPKTGKSFLALDLALHVASGVVWMGHATRKGRVVYVLAEGQGDLSNRIRAWLEQHRGVPVPDDAVTFVLRPVNLLSQADVDGFLQYTATMPEPPALIIFDTLARCLPAGDENSAKDVGEAVQALDRIRAETGAAVLVLHHTNKAGQQERGSTALRGAVDGMFVLVDDSGSLTLSCDAMRYGARFDPLPLKLEVVNLPDGQTSCVVRFETHRERIEALESGHLKPNQQKVIDTIYDLDHGDGVSWSQLEETTKTPKATLSRILRDLEATGYVTKDLKRKRFRLTDRGKDSVSSRFH
ncbi:AAA family ATPase [Caldinitratiruptor microaerophilus]|uniref:Uncharacterized protein n=1 Tax=Caldinitratiruptor microaerophilus TaxID=671077 RepID=A0AA35CMA9_9FIRM|nr:AAA family ATPase [Caldinitratiruptor microaerophilus]BDG59920.1 hypothetical protein caldi_10100 [Caldinitratiruptor microaerophilus]